MGEFKLRFFGPPPIEGGHEAQKSPHLPNMLQAHVMSQWTPEKHNGLALLTREMGEGGKVRLGFYFCFFSDFVESMVRQYVACANNVYGYDDRRGRGSPLT